MDYKKILMGIWVIFISLAFVSMVSALSIKDVSSSPDEIAPGEVATVSIKIENIFEEDVENVNVKVDLSEVPFAPYQSSSEEFLDELEEGDKETFEFELIAFPQTPSGVYKIPVEISYEGLEKPKIELISLIVNSKPKLTASLEDSVVLIKGMENEIEIKIVNSGLSDVRFVDLEASDTSNIEFLTNKNQYLGNIDSDDFDSIEYKIYIKPNAADSINLLVKLNYKDSTNKEYSETQMITLKTYSLKEAQSLGLVEKQSYTLYFVGGLGIVGFVIYKILKKRKLKKKREKN